MSVTTRVLVSHDGPGWLPLGGRADVVLAGRDAEVPDPTCLVRLLVTRGDRVLAVPRPDGRGLDIPTRAVAGGTPEESLRALAAATLGDVRPVALLGWVRNVVPTPPADYPWPSPEAHFVVWHCALPTGVDVEGEWLDPVRAEAHLGDRHWWPLAATLHRGPTMSVPPSTVRP